MGWKLLCKSEKFPVLEKLQKSFSRIRSLRKFFVCSAIKCVCKWRQERKEFMTQGFHSSGWNNWRNRDQKEWKKLSNGKSFPLRRKNLLRCLCVGVCGIKVMCSTAKQLIQSLYLYFSVRNLGRAHDEDNNASVSFRFMQASWHQCGCETRGEAFSALSLKEQKTIKNIPSKLTNLMTLASAWRNSKWVLFCRFVNIEGESSYMPDSCVCLGDLAILFLMFLMKLYGKNPKQKLRMEWQALSL